MGGFSWQLIFSPCVNPRSNNDKPQIITSSSPHRISLSDLSYPDGSEITASDLSTSMAGSKLCVFTHDELRLITNNFSSTNYIGEGGFGAVYKGFIDDKVRSGVLDAQAVAVKVLDLEGNQGHKEWLTEVIFLGQLTHPHLVKLIGYCYEKDQRQLVYEYMDRGNLDRHLFMRCSAPLPWLTRIKIALGAAKGLAFLHEQNKPVIFRDFKAANILLTPDYTSKLSDFGFARDGPGEGKSHISTKNILGTKGYVAPEYIMTGHLTTMSDVYSFGVVLLELLTGRRSMDKARPRKQQSLVEWGRPCLKDPRKLELIMDSAMEGQYSPQGARKAALLAYQCLSRQAKSRPTMGSVVNTLEMILEMKDDIVKVGTFVYVVPPVVRPAMDECRRKEKKDDDQVGADEQGKVAARKRERRKNREMRTTTVGSVLPSFHSDQCKSEQSHEQT